MPDPIFHPSAAIGLPKALRDTFLGAKGGETCLRYPTQRYYIDEIEQIRQKNGRNNKT